MFSSKQNNAQWELPRFRNTCGRLKALVCVLPVRNVLESALPGVAKVCSRGVSRVYRVAMAEIVCMSPRKSGFAAGKHHVGCVSRTPDRRSLECGVKCRFKTRAPTRDGFDFTIGFERAKRFSPFFYGFPRAERPLMVGLVDGRLGIGGVQASASNVYGTNGGERQGELRSLQIEEVGLGATTLILRKCRFRHWLAPSGEQLHCFSWLRPESA